SPLSLRLAVLLLAVLLVPAVYAGSDDNFLPTDDSKRLVKQAEKLMRGGRYQDAERVYRRAIELDPDNSLAKLRLAYALSKMRKLVDAYEISFAIAQAEPDNAYALSVLGTTLLNAGRFVDARQVIFAAIQKDRKDALAWASYGLLEFYENNIDESLLNLKEAVYYEPNEPDFVFALAQVSARAERFKEAADAYERFLSISRDTDKDRRDRIRGLVNFLKYLGGRNALYRMAGSDSDVLNFRLIGNRPVMEVRVNDRKEPLRFVLDTGSGITVLSDETAERLKIKPVARGGFARGIGGDGQFEIVYGFLKSVDMGQVKIRNVPIYIRHFHNNVNRIDGYIGLSLISKFLTTVDYGSQTFALESRKDRGLAPSDGSINIPLRLTSSGFLSGHVQLPGVKLPLNFIVDTGASISVISEQLASLEPVSSFERGEPLRVIGAGGITEAVPSFNLPKVSFGAHSREDIAAIALSLDTINEVAGFEQAGILGGNFLRNYKMTFDFTNSVVSFSPIETVP
ncbi:MAG TPA: aspartyl protease family protein, partial [Pyrinomonadaceae bacterium]|nr:aspartyl protease family protein [Pyrinomonadaceae bacterium]